MISSFLTATLLVGLLAAGEARRAESAQAPASKPAVSVPFFGNETCPISGKPVDKARLVELDGQPVFLCCGMCASKANADAKATAAKAYPRTVALENKSCPVMGDPIEKDSKSSAVIAGRVVKLCCDDCGAAAKKDFAATLAKATDEKRVDLDNAKCICGAASTGKWVAVADGKIVRLCSAACADAAAKDPKKLASVAPGKKP